MSLRGPVVNVVEIIQTIPNILDLTAGYLREQSASENCHSNGNIKTLSVEHHNLPLMIVFWDGLIHVISEAENLGFIFTPVALARLVVAENKKNSSKLASCLRMKSNCPFSPCPMLPSNARLGLWVLSQGDCRHLATPNGDRIGTGVVQWPS